MLVVITYDVNTETAAGRKRLRQIIRRCVSGRRIAEIPYLDAHQ